MNWVIEVDCESREREASFKLYYNILYLYIVYIKI